MRKRDEKRESKTDHTVDKANIIDGDKEGPGGTRRSSRIPKVTEKTKAKIEEKK